MIEKLINPVCNRSPLLIYKFRSLERLLDDGELDKGYIHLSSLWKLNDPLDGYIDFEFDGEKNEWRGFFKFYIYSYFTIRFYSDKNSGPNKKMSIDDLNSMLCDQNFVYSYIERDTDLKDVCNKILDSQFVKGMITQITKSVRDAPSLVTLYKKQPLSSDNLLEYLEELREYIVPIAKTDFPSFKETFKNKGEQIPNSDVLELYNQILLRRHKDCSFFVFMNNYSKYFLKNLYKLIFRTSYIASFSNNLSNIAMWGYYANESKGACLIFKTSKHKGKHALYLSNAPNEEYTPRILHKVIYKKILHKAPFFKLLGNNMYDIINKYWSSNNSKLLLSKKNYSDDYTRETQQKVLKTKLQYWKHEEELRIFEFIHIDEPDNISHDGLDLYYKIESLQGIVFGCNADVVDIFLSIERIKERVKKSKTSKDIKIYFYKAKYIASKNEIVPVLLGKIKEGEFTYEP